MATLAQREDIHLPQPRSRTRHARRSGVLGLNEESLARGLGWFSIGLGVAELLTPQSVGRLVGTRNSTSLLRMAGAREFAAGIGILSRPRPATWVWSRVGGDLMDLAFLTSLFWERRANKNRAATATAIVAGVTALDVLCAQTLSGTPLPFMSARPLRVHTSIIVNKSPEECYRFWRRYENLPRFMAYVRSVRGVSEKRSYWQADVPGGMSIEWNAELMDDVPDQRISWRSVPGSDISNAGTVRFDRAPGGRGCIVRLEMEYSFPGNKFGSAMAKLVGKEPGQVANKNLRRFKQIIETGTVVTTEGQPAGRSSGATWLDSIAR